MTLHWTAPFHYIVKYHHGCLIACLSHHYITRFTHKCFRFTVLRANSEYFYPFHIIAPQQQWNVTKWVSYNSHLLSRLLGKDLVWAFHYLLKNLSQVGHQEIDIAWEVRLCCNYFGSIGYDMSCCVLLCLLWWCLLCSLIHYHHYPQKRLLSWCHLDHRVSLPAHF